MLGIISILLLYFQYHFGLGGGLGYLLYTVVYSPAIMVSIQIFGIFERPDMNILYVIYFSYGFITGALIGWLYGKIKNRDFPRNFSNN